MKTWEQKYSGEQIDEVQGVLDRVRRRLLVLAGYVSGANADLESQANTVCVVDELADELEAMLDELGEQDDGAPENASESPTDAKGKPKKKAA